MVQRQIDRHLPRHQTAPGLIDVAVIVANRVKGTVERVARGQRLHRGRGNGRWIQPHQLDARRSSTARGSLGAGSHNKSLEQLPASGVGRIRIERRRDSGRSDHGKALCVRVTPLEREGGDRCRGDQPAIQSISVRSFEQKRKLSLSKKNHVVNATPCGWEKVRNYSWDAMTFFVGLDWAATAHASVCFEEPAPSTGAAPCRIRPRAWPTSSAGSPLRPPHTLPIAIERPSGVLIDTLLDAGFQVVPFTRTS